MNVNTTAQSRLCDPFGVGPGCRLPPVFLNRNRTERSDRSTELYRGRGRTKAHRTVPVARVAVVEQSVEALNIKSSQVS